MSDGTTALPLLRHVILNDQKSATYKLGLLRAISCPDGSELWRANQRIIMFGFRWVSSCVWLAGSNQVARNLAVADGAPGGDLVAADVDGDRAARVEAAAGWR